MAQVLRLAEGAIKASSYTNAVDSDDLANPRKAAKRKQRQAQEVGVCMQTEDDGSIHTKCIRIFSFQHFA
jgi:hypothetical protein